MSQTKAKKKPKGPVRVKTVPVIKDLVFATTAKNLVSQLSTEHAQIIEKMKRLAEQAMAMESRIASLNEILGIYASEVTRQQEQS